MLYFVLCYFIIFPLKENIVTRTAIGKECLTALHLNCGENLTEKNLKLNYISTWRKTRSLRVPCYDIKLDWHFGNLLLPRICLFDRSWWSYMIYSMDIEEVLMVSMHKKWTYICWWYWSNILQVVTVADVRHCCRIAEVRHCCWVADVRYLVCYKALFIEASFAIAYCIVQYLFIFILFFAL